MNNKYSITLLAIMLTLMVTGGINLFHRGELKGLVPFTLGVLMLTGLKGPKSTSESPTRKIWLLTFLGKQTRTIVTSLTLVLNWPFPIVGYIEVELKQVDQDFPLKKPIYCQEDGAYVDGLVSISMIPDDKDDPDGMPHWKSGGEKIQDFLNIDGIAGAKTQLDDILTAWVQKFGNKHSSVWMETQSMEISGELLRRIMEGKVATGHPHGDIDDTTGFGLRFPKFQVILRPVEAVMNARNDYLVEEAQRRAELMDTETMNRRIAARAEVYESRGETRTMKEIRDELFDENTLKAGKYQKTVNQGGLNVSDVTNRGGTT
ncbi:MAG: hypothetical protein Q8Q03_01430 [bacterium]|nr:hypothetical protein [bacterium]